MNDNTPPRVRATAAALALIDTLRQEHGPILFHQSGGCCDGSSPMCYPQDDFLIGDGDVKLGEIGGVPVYIGGAQFEAWRHTQLIIDVVPGRGGMFSLDNGREQRFLTRSRAFRNEELAQLGEAPRPGPEPSGEICAVPPR
ncbi:DUF779 domain-containing protein [Pseudoroseomonas globiformis]|uniref:DUF779 domain-containing protein n=1 Tax=Teichococcus globiformis TaxID=2307229 RepID=A0ABV7FT66_9PROT